MSKIYVDLENHFQNFINKGGVQFMETLEIVFGNSCYMSMKESKLQKNNILLFNLLLNVGDLSLIEEYKINIPNELCNETSNYFFENEMKIINETIKRNNKIRIWTSHYNIYSYLIMLYICSNLKNSKCELYVTYSDEYGNDKYCVSPSMMNLKELEKLSKLEHKLSKNDILKFSKIWENIIKNNSEMRVLENGIVKSVSISYYDSMIIDNLKLLGTFKISKLVAILMQKIYLMDILYVYLIKRLIKNGKIKIVEKDKDIFFNNVVELV